MAIKVTDKSRHDMGTISPLPSIYSYLPKISCAHVWQNCAHARNHHPYNFALCRSLVRGHCLRVNVKRDPTVCVPQKLLHGFDVLSVCLQQRAEGVAKGMPTNVLGDTSLLCDRLDVPLHEIVWPIGLAFAPTPEIVEALRAKGAGPLTLEAIEVLSPKGSHGATANRKEPPSTMQLGPGIITTVAGNGTCSSPRNQYGVCPDSSPSGDGGTATSVQLNSPGGVAVDGSDNLYITDVRHNVIRKVNRHGIITTIAGNGTCGYSGDHGPATSAQLDLRMGGGIAADALGNIYFGDAFQNVVRKVSVGGIITTVAGNGTSGYSGDNGSATSAQLNYPQGVAIDTAGNLYINDSTNQRIRKVSPIGIITTVAGNGNPGYSGDNGPATNAQVKNPKGIAVDTLGNLFIGSEERIRKVSRNGIITTVAGSGYCAQIAGGNCVQGGYFGDGGAATMAQLNYPLGVAVDTSGNIYIDDWLNSRIRRVSTQTSLNSDVTAATIR
jgi:hypothetical protein